MLHAALLGHTTNCKETPEEIGAKNIFTTKTSNRLAIEMTRNEGSDRDAVNEDVETCQPVKNRMREMQRSAIASGQDVGLGALKVIQPSKKSGDRRNSGM